MTDAETLPADTAVTDPLANVPAWARGRMLRHLEILDEAAEVGLKVVRAVGRRIDDDPAPGDVEAIARAYAKASRALRQTIMLQDRLMRDVRDWAEDALDRDRPEREARRKDRAQRIVGRIADLDEEVSDARFIKEAQEYAEDLLDDEDLYGDLLERPLSDLVDQLCGNLGLKPNWRRIAAEPWAVKELEAGQACAPLLAAAKDQTRPLPQAGEVSRRDGEGIPPPLSFEPALPIAADSS
jgi:hypothetical protein